MSSDANTIEAKIESLTAEKAEAQAALTKAREAKQEVERDLQTYGAKMDGAQRAKAAANLEELRQVIKKLRRKIDALTGKIKAQEQLLELALQVEAADERANAAQAQAAVEAAAEVEHAAAAEVEPDSGKREGHNRALRDAQRRRAARQREAADLAAQAAGLAEQVVSRAASIDEEPDEDRPEPEPEYRPRRGLGLGGLGLALALGALLLSRK
jgi:chromosome segregation ATPase